MLLGNYNSELGVYVWQNDVVTSIYYERSDSITLVYYGNLVLKSDRIDPIYIPSAWVDYAKTVRDLIMEYMDKKKKGDVVDNVPYGNIPYGKIGPMVE